MDECASIVTLGQFLAPSSGMLCYGILVIKYIREVHAYITLF